MRSDLALAAAVFPIFFGVAVQAQVQVQQKIWGTVIWTLHGESTPYAYLEDRTLTPLGAQQLFRAGSAFRSRYINPSRMSSIMSYHIDGISRERLRPDQLNIISVPDQFISASAQAFMQGLYPPGLSNNASFPEESSLMADGTVLDFPLDGYQYPQMYTPNTKDPTYIWISGHTNCPMRTDSMERYLLTDEYQRIQSETSGFYSRLYTFFLDEHFSSYRSVYANALLISEYLSYLFTHNPSRGNRPAPSDVDHARSLADQLVFTMNGDLTVQGQYENDRIRAVAGRTLAATVLSGLERNILTDGDISKMTILFGSFEPMIAFYSLAQLSSGNRPEFNRIPEFGSSLIFELYSLEENATASYPTSRSDLMVRFLVQNGTDHSSSPIPYPLFGHGPGVIGISYSEFEAEMRSIMLSSAEEWCAVCNSSNVFCPFYQNQDSSSVSRSSSGSCDRLKPVAAGFIGAAVTIVFFAICIAISVLLLTRKSPKSLRPESRLFRGRRKLPSNPDLAGGGSFSAAVSRDRDMSVGTTGAWGSDGEPEGVGNSLEMMPLSEHPGNPFRDSGQGMGRGWTKLDAEDVDLHVITLPQPITVREHV